jgi:hypothetical protein
VAGRQPLEVTVRTRDVTVRAGSDVDDDASAVRLRRRLLSHSENRNGFRRGPQR